LTSDLRLVNRADHEMDNNYFRFCIAESLLKLLLPNIPDVERRLVQWLFPQVGRWNWPAQVDARNLRSPILTLGVNATVRCTLEYRAKTEDYLVTVEIESTDRDATSLMTNLKLAIWIKLILAIRQLRKSPTNVALNRRSLAGIRRMKGYDLIDQVDSILPFA